MSCSCGSKTKSSCCCDLNEKVLASNILYDCEGFVCAGFPTLTISVGDSLCSVMSSILTTLCDLTDNQFSIVNVGLGAPIWKGTTSGVAELRTLTAGTGITITPGADEIEIASVFSTPYNALELETLATTIPAFAFPLTAANTVPALELSIPSNGNYYITGTANITISHSETSNFFFVQNIGGIISQLGFKYNANFNTSGVESITMNVTLQTITTLSIGGLNIGFESTNASTGGTINNLALQFFKIN